VAGFRTHIGFSTLLGAAYGAAAKPLGFPPETAILAAGVTAVGGMLPDLDSDSGTPVRELSGLAAAVIPLLLVPRMLNAGMTQEGALAAVGLLYLFIRYGMGWLFRRLTVHRGMFHSIPCMAIFGLIVFLAYETPHLATRLLLAGGVMLGFLSHLVLDEVYSVDFNGVRLKLKSSAGSALKFFSPSVVPNLVCYVILAGLGVLAYLEWSQKVGRPVVSGMELRDAVRRAQVEPAGPRRG
jgi:membrane-bound metal-dependent hydrolase YbcI (DUF457 family)